MLNIRAKFHANPTFTFREITTSVTDKPTNQRKNTLDHNNAARSNNEQCSAEKQLQYLFELCNESCDVLQRHWILNR